MAPQPSNTIVSTAVGLLIKNGGSMTVGELQHGCREAHRLWAEQTDGQQLFVDDFMETNEAWLSQTLHTAILTAFKIAGKTPTTNMADILQRPITVDELLGTSLVDSGKVQAPSAFAVRKRGRHS